MTEEQRSQPGCIGAEGERVVPSRALTRLAVVALLLHAACSSTPRVTITEAWPDTVDDYDDVHDRWTRHAQILNGLDFVIDVHATLLSTEFRAAYAARRARHLLLPDEERGRLLAQQRDAAASDWEVELLVATARHEWADFHKGDKSMWRLALVGDDGREVLPTSVKLDRRSREEIGVYYRHMSPFYKAYIVRFPKTAADGRPLIAEGSPRIVLKLGSGLGGLQLEWLSK